jgi:hypothetical protein
MKSSDFFMFWGDLAENNGHTIDYWSCFLGLVVCTTHVLVGFAMLQAQFATFFFLIGKEPMNKLYKTLFCIPYYTPSKSQLIVYKLGQYKLDIMAPKMLGLGLL